MATRSYPRLSIETFGKTLLEAGDLDPVYDALRCLSWPREQLSRFLVAYWCLYHVGASCWLSGQEGDMFWRQLTEAAVNDRPGPTGGRWPRSPERRHWRGANALKSVEDLKRRFRTAEEMVSWCGSGVLHMPAWPPGYQVGYTEVTGRVTQLSAFGPWIAFKVADMLERCVGVPVAFPANAVMYSEPTEAALMLWRQVLRVPEGAKVKDPQAAITKVLQHLEYVFNDYPAPGGGRTCALQELETILCKWKSHMGGHYAPGHDLVEIRDGLLPWTNVSLEAAEFLAALPACGPIDAAIPALPTGDN